MRDVTLMSVMFLKIEMYVYQNKNKKNNQFEN